MLYKVILSAVVIIMGLAAFINKISSGKSKQALGSVYDFKMKSLAGEEIDFLKFKGKKILIVNTASKCGYTNQYEDLQKLHEQYGDRVAILGFPANNFLWQEPGTNQDIADFCKVNYGVTFQMFEKISIKGKDQHPLYTWLQSKSGEKPTWNFCKYLIDEKGNIIGFFNSKVNPMDKQIVDKI